jgi:hypothetical protein
MQDGKQLSAKHKEEWTNVRFRRHIEGRLSRGEQQELTEDLKIISNKRLYDFFHDYFYTAVAVEQEVMWLNFIAPYISGKIFSNWLADRDCYPLRIFAGGAHTLEISGVYSEHARRLRIEKFKVLLQNAEELVTSFMEKYENSQDTEKVRLEYTCAKEELIVQRQQCQFSMV